jgi:hypothetical protein
VAYVPANLVVSMKKTIIQLDDQKITIEKLPLGKYADLMRALQNLPAKFKDINMSNNEQFFAQLPAIIADNIPEVVDLLNIATGMQKEEIEALGLHEVVNLVVAVIEVNQYKDVYEQIKKVTARPATQAVA